MKNTENMKNTGGENEARAEYAKDHEESLAWKIQVVRVRLAEVDEQEWQGFRYEWQGIRYEWQGFE